MNPQGTAQLILYYLMVVASGIGIVSLIGLVLAILVLHLTEPKQYRRPK
jgi:hypothetical protein